MADRGKQIDTSTAEGASRPTAQPKPPGPAQKGRVEGDGKHEVPEPGERADDEADQGEKRMTRQE